jgi:excinuclease ABC subunit B
VFDVIVGVNLLREGLDLPEVSLIAIMDADKEGFLRSTTSLIQTIGRAARNVAGKVIMYADNLTQSMKNAIGETNRRRLTQETYNTEHGIKPETIRKAIKDMLSFTSSKDVKLPEITPGMTDRDLKALIQQLTDEMNLAAAMLEFEQAAKIRDKIAILKGELITKGKGQDYNPTESKRTSKARSIKDKLAQASMKIKKR